MTPKHVKALCVNGLRNLVHYREALTLMDKKGQPGNFFRAALGQTCRSSELDAFGLLHYCFMFTSV